MKKQTNAISQKYNESTILRIFEIYQKPDSKKYNKYVHALRVMENLDGWGFKILYHSKYNFACGFLYENDKKEIRLYFFAANDSEHDYKYYA